MTKAQALIAEVYGAFNERDVDGALALMSERVSWPKASEGGGVEGKAEVRAYWTRQWKEFDPHVMPLEVIECGSGRVDVRVHQLVKNLAGDVLSEGEVWHFYTLVEDRIARMELRGGAADSEQAPSLAFHPRGGDEEPV